MIDLQKTCCTLEQAIRLKELGIRQDSYFLIGKHANVITEMWSITGDEDDFYACYTRGELGFALPSHTPSRIADGHTHSICENGRPDTYPLGDCIEDEATTPPYILNREILPMQTGSTEAEACANMLIFQLENNLITAEEVNQRLANA